MYISPEIQRRYTAFWDRSATDRACAYMHGSDGSPAFKAPVDANHKWEDIPERLERSIYEGAHTRYFAEGFPSVFVNFGPGCLTACIGGSYKPAPNTVWFENQPFFVENWENRVKPRLDPDSRMYKMIEELSDGLLLHKNELCTSITDMGGTYDIIAALRGTENLLYDLYDNPDEVKALRDEIAPIWRDYFLAHSKRLIAEQGGHSSWMPIWSDKSYYPLQCDFCAMLSPKMFGEFILPDLKEQTELMDRAIYHLDGPGELPHVDMLLSLPRLNAIQWTSGAGNAPLWDKCWFELYRRIQAAGKGIVLLGFDRNHLEELLSNVSQRGLYIDMYVADEQEARELIDMMKRLNR